MRIKCDKLKKYARSRRRKVLIHWPKCEPEHDAEGVAVGRRGALAAVDELGRRPLERALEAAHLRAVAGQDARQAHVLHSTE